MKKLLEFIIKGIIGREDFLIEESSQNGGIDLLIKVPTTSIGIIIGKNGKTIRAIRNILKVKATLGKEAVMVNVIEKV